VIGPEHDTLRDHYTRGVRPARLSVSFAVQQQPRGTADAVLAAEDFAGQEPFLVLNSDNYYPVESYAALRRLDGPGVTGFTRRGLVADGHISPERVAGFAILDVDADHVLRRIVEKPGPAAAALGGDALVGMNCWRFGRRIFEACRAIGPSVRGEVELPIAVQYAIDRLGERFQVVPFDLPVLDLSTRHDIAFVARALEGTRVVL
jgi:glucose-1-phosphate thymidylyltransferase